MASFIKGRKLLKEGNVVNHEPGHNLSLSTEQAVALSLSRLRVRMQVLLNHRRNFKHTMYAPFSALHVALDTGVPLYSAALDWLVQDQGRVEMSSG